MTRTDGIELRERASTVGVVNMDRFEADLGRVASPPTSPDSIAKRPQTAGLSKHSPLQTIADAIKRLVWDDNERLGELIGALWRGQERINGSGPSACSRRSSGSSKGSMISG